MPDGRLIPLGSYESRIMSARALGEQEARAEQDHQDWLRFAEHMDGLLDVIGSIEARYSTAFLAYGPLQDIAGDVAGTLSHATALAAMLFREG